MKFSGSPARSLAIAIIAIGLLIGLSLYLLSNDADILLAKRIAAGVALGLLLVGSFVLLLDKNALRSYGTGPDKPYSFSRVQMWWWAIIILGSYFGVYAATGNYWSMNSTCLILLGISSITTSGGRMIDGNKQEQRTQRNEPELPLLTSRGIIFDILSDSNGLSVQRFQAFVFNVAYGLSFVVEVFSDINKGSFPVYDATVLALLGVSSGTYLAMKTSETGKLDTNAAPVKATPATTTASTLPPQNDELPDADLTAADQPEDN